MDMGETYSGFQPALKFDKIIRQALSQSSQEPQK